jgi:RNA polymerase sigma-70 factor (ECF subfamily)
VDDQAGNLLAQARAARPDLAVPDGFAARLEALTPEPGAQLHAGDLLLASACAAGDPAALAVFEREIMSDVPHFVARFRAGASFADEVAQAARDKLLVATADAAPRITEYAGRGPLRAWVRVAATRIALDLLRERGSAPERELDEELAIDQASSPELEVLKARYREQFQASLEAALAELSPKQRTLLRMHHVDGFSLDRLATMQRVHRATIARWLADARDEIVTRTYEHLREHVAVGTSEFDSVVALVRSQLHLSVNRLLK